MSEHVWWHLRCPTLHRDVFRRQLEFASPSRAPSQLSPVELDMEVAYNRSKRRLKQRQTTTLHIEKHVMKSVSKAEAKQHYFEERALKVAAPGMAGGGGQNFMQGCRPSLMPYR